MPTLFTWNPDRGASTKSKPRVLQARFGDGYGQRAPDGLNSNNKTWTLAFVNRSSTEGNAILAFFDSRLGVTSFLYSPIGDTNQYLVVCTEWTSSVTTPGIVSIHAKFEEVQG